MACLMNELLKNINSTGKVIKKYNKKHEKMLQRINKKVDLRNRKKNKINKLEHVELVRDINVDKESENVKSISRQLLIYGIITIIAILIQIYLVFFV